MAARFMKNRPKPRLPVPSEKEGQLQKLFEVAFSFNSIVWLAGEEVYPGRKFTDYVLLGDDILIADTKVAGVNGSKKGRMRAHFPLIDLIPSKAIVTIPTCLFLI
ncbi:mitovirus RNA-dependent RNA polymerase [Striga asiatica]|uniref:Mitovirus RNA-dependent RNA polymerase n=1 Tax=Striga asiatica TaxID=4170 RepID=A0A5A7PZ70_STRAF|nr:mitovirus RNA-dependent RNA polymerase [Striga asiatica]